MSSLTSCLDANAPRKTKADRLSVGNVYYNLEDTVFDPEEAYKQMVQRVAVGAMTLGIEAMSLEDEKGKPQPIVKFKKRSDGLVAKMGKLDIQEY